MANTKIVNATWMAARVQPYFSEIGLTNSVHPYCRLAIIAMQTMPIASCPHRNCGLGVLCDELVKAGLAWLMER